MEQSRRLYSIKKSKPDVYNLAMATEEQNQRIDDTAISNIR